MCEAFRRCKQYPDDKRQNRYSYNNRYKDSCDFIYQLLDRRFTSLRSLYHPDNLRLTPDGKVKILDLGAAKDLSVNNGASSMQVAKGGFSPFEQYTQRGSSGPWTDVYAMAATVYYTLTGKLPPVATDRVVEDTISWDEPGLKALSAQALEALQKAMVISAKNRMQSMEELEKGLYSTAVEPAPTPAPQPVQETQTGTSTRAGGQTGPPADTGTRTSGSIGTKTKSGGKVREKALDCRGGGHCRRAVRGAGMGKRQQTRR